MMFENSLTLDFAYPVYAYGIFAVASHELRPLKGSE